MAAELNPVQRFIVEHVEQHSADIALVTAQRFGISRQAVHRHIHQLIDEGILDASGRTAARRYFLRVLSETTWTFPISPGLGEDKPWRESLSPLLSGERPNVLSICQYGFTEIFNNAIEHSEGQSITVRLKRTFPSIQIVVDDNGVGILEKIRTKLHMEDERQAILELAKGKLTTDPERHTGEGIFFVSRMFDTFSILSGKLFFIHRVDDDDWMIETHTEGKAGTLVEMSINPRATRTTREIFDRYAAESDEYGFTRTHVPVALARYGVENLVSRSQARRLLARFDRFREVLLDFDKIETIGQAFADEVFRVFRNQNPSVKILFIRANEEVTRMIQRAQREAGKVSGMQPGK